MIERQWLTLIVIDHQAIEASNEDDESKQEIARESNLEMANARRKNLYTEETISLS